MASALTKGKDPAEPNGSNSVGFGGLSQGESSTNGKGPSKSSWLSSATSVAGGAFSVAKDVSNHWTKELYRSVLRRDPSAYYQHLMEVATSFEQWAAAASVLDRLQGKDVWKQDPKSAHYDCELIKDRLAQLQKARESGDLSSMIFLLRTSLSRNLGDMGNSKLYTHCRVGTIKLIEDYIDEVCRQLVLICENEYPDFPTHVKYEFFTNTQRSFGRTALLLSGGAIFGLAHIGVVKALYEAKLLPRIINGSSSGSIIAAAVGTRTDEELPILLDPRNLSLDVFERPSERGNLFIKLARFLKHGVVFDVEVFIEAMRSNIGDLTFQEAFYRTRRILNITVSSSTTFEMPRLLNYLTAPNVVIWSAVAASCAIPFVYRSAPLMAKDKSGKISPWNPSGHRWIDGSVENDLPMARIAELFNVNHFIVCQVNPHVIPFMQHTLQPPSTIGKMMGKVSWLVRSEIQHRLTQLTEIGLRSSLVYMAQSILAQKYYGDITIVPSISPEKYMEIVANPDVEMLTKYTIIGEKATWPLISMIQNHCQIELCIDQMLYRLRIRKLTGAGGAGVVGAGRTRMSPAKVEGLDLETIRALQGVDASATSASPSQPDNNAGGPFVRVNGTMGQRPSSAHTSSERLSNGTSGRNVSKFRVVLKPGYGLTRADADMASERSSSSSSGVSSSSASDVVADVTVGTDEDEEGDFDTEREVGEVEVEAGPDLDDGPLEFSNSRSAPVQHLYPDLLLTE